MVADPRPPVKHQLDNWRRWMAAASWMPRGATGRPRFCTAGIVGVILLILLGTRQATIYCASFHAVPFLPVLQEDRVEPYPPQGLFSYNHAMQIAVTQVDRSGAGRISLWNADSVESTAIGGHISSDAACTALSPSGDVAAVGFSSGAIHVLDVRRSACARIVHCPARPTKLALSADGALLASGAADGSLMVWNSASGEECWRTKGHCSAISMLRFVPGSGLMVSGGKDGFIRVWNMRSGQLLDCHPCGAPVGGMSFNSAGSMAALISGKGREVEVRSFPGWKPIRLLKQESVINCVDFSPDGTAVAAGTVDGTVVLWDAPSGRKRGIFLYTGATDLSEEEEYSAPIRFVSFSADGRSLLAWYSDGARYLLAMPSDVIA